MIKISVIIPVYNSENYLKACIDSGLNQTFGDNNYELIIINDCSTDKSSTILKKFNKKDNIKILNNLYNKGVSYSRNLGIKQARGKYIIFLDADDMLTKNALKDMYDLAELEQADLLISNFNVLKEQSLKEPHFQKSFKNTFHKKGEVNLKTHPELLYNLYICSKLIKKELLLNNLFPEDISYAEDQVTIINCMAKSRKTVVLPQITYIYRNVEINQSATQRAMSNPKKYLESSLEAFKLIEKEHSDISNFAANNFFIFTYLQRFVEGTIAFLFENIIINRNNEVTLTALEVIHKWINELNPRYILESPSFEKVFLYNGELYFEHLEEEYLQKKYIEIIKAIKLKKQEASEKFHQSKYEINNLLSNIDLIFKSELSSPILNPHIQSLKLLEKTFEFKLNFCRDNNLMMNHYEAIIRKETESNEYKVLKVYKLNKENKKLEFKANNKIKILLLYKDYSGSNSVSMYKNIPDKFKNSEKFEINLHKFSKADSEYFNLIRSSHVIITTNMELHAKKYGIDLSNKFVIDLWHGVPLKNMFFTDPYFYNKNTISEYWNQFDCLISYSSMYTHIVSKSLKVPTQKFIVTGAPRNDLIFTPKLESQKKLSNVLNVDLTTLSNKKIVFFVPTFRSSDVTTKESDNIFLFKESFDVFKFNSFLSENNILLIMKIHPIVQKRILSDLNKLSNLKVISNESLMNEEVDFYELLNSSDALITDYSSIYFDYLLLNKPIYFNITDKEEYMNERGFAIENFEAWTPGIKFKNYEELKNIFKESHEEKDKFMFEREVVMNKVHDYVDDNSSLRVWNLIEKIIM